MKCGRTLKRDPVQGMGPVCARAVLGAKPRKEAKPAVKRDELTRELWTDEDPPRPTAYGLVCLGAAA